MSLNKKHVSLEKKMTIVQAYVKGKKSLRAVAKQYSVPYPTLWFWVKQYKKEGEDGLQEKKVSGRRTPSDIERKVWMLKEGSPGLSIHKAQERLQRKGIKLSQKGIWSIWKRTGVAKRSLDAPLSSFCPATPVSQEVIRRARKLLRVGDPKAAAKLLNSIPCMPENRIIEKIPEKLLSPRRQLDRVYFGFARLSFPECRKKAHAVSKKLERGGYIYSSIVANFIELNALDWMVKPEEKIPILDVLMKKMGTVKDSALRCLLYMHLATTYCDTMQIRKSLNYVRKIRKLIYRLKSTYYMRGFGHILTGLGRYSEAVPYYERALQQSTDPEQKKRLIFIIATFGFALAGDYEGAKKLYVKAKTGAMTVRQKKTFIVLQAFIAFGHGNLEKSTDCFRESLETARKEEFFNEIYVTSTGLAAIAAALNKKKQAETYLRKYLPLMKKGGLTREVLLLEHMLGLRKQIPKELLYIPPLRLLHLMVQANKTTKTGDYRKAFRFAQQQKLLGLFHRWIVFFPKSVQKFLETNKPTGLPRSVLGFPIFSQNTPVYHIKFLGRCVIMKNQKYVRARLSPRENAFLIHLALRVGTPGKSVVLQELCDNFWPNSKEPTDLLLHLVAQLKRKLSIPSHFLSVSSSYPEPRFVNHGIYLTTDYGDFETLMSQVRTLERANEWTYAKRDYLKALAFLRGEPFKKMYDAWSESMRSVVLRRYEDSVAQFVKGCTQHDAEQDARKVLEKCVTAIPHSNEIRKLFDTMRT